MPHERNDSTSDEEHLRRVLRLFYKDIEGWRDGDISGWKETLDRSARGVPGKGLSSWMWIWLTTEIQTRAGPITVQNLPDREGVVWLRRGGILATAPTLGWAMVRALAMLLDRAPAQGAQAS